MFFESLAECSLGFTYVCVAVVDVTRNVTDGSTLVFFRCFVYRVYYHRASCSDHRPSCSDHRATYGSPGIDLRRLLFVLGSRFALDGVCASVHHGYPLALRALWTCVSSDFLSSAVMTYCCALLVRVRTSCGLEGDVT